jgi:hypothetical protein
VPAGSAASGLEPKVPWSRQQAQPEGQQTRE